MTTKKTYTHDDIEELNKWFDSNKDKLPQTMQIDRSAYSPNLAKTIDTLFTQAFICYSNPKMLGCILILEKIKANVEEGLAKEKE